MVDSFDALEEDVQSSDVPLDSEPDYTYDESSNTWVWIATGIALSAAEITNEMRFHVTGTFELLNSLTNRLYDGSITLSQWELAVASELKDAHVAMAAFGAGGQANMTQAQLLRLRGTLEDQYAFLDGFANDIANGTQSRAQALARVRQYGRASQQSYWNEYIRSREGLILWNLNPAEHCGDCVSLQDGNPYTWDTLPTVPGAGDTECRG